MGESRVPPLPSKLRNFPKVIGPIRDLDHIPVFEPPLSSQHQNSMRANCRRQPLRIRTMTCFPGISIVTIGAALSMTAGLALAGETTVSASKIVNALSQAGHPWPVGRCAGRPGCQSKGNRLRRHAAQPADTLALARRARGDRTRSPRPSRRSIWKFTSTTTRPISARPRSSAVQELGKALSDASLKGSTFVVAGHTDAIGGESYNQELSGSAAPIRSGVPDREIRHRRAPTSSPSATARPSRRIRTRRWTRPTAAFRSSTWTPKPRRSDT